MCMCECGANMDNCCCSMKTKQWVFGGWTVEHFFIGLAVELTRRYLLHWYWLLYLNYVILGLHLLGGVFLLIGCWKGIGALFLTGIILSSFFPYLGIASIYLPIMQIIFTITACRYYQTIE